MDDRSLNRELDAALNVEPSPEFLVRVRMRIASEPQPSRWSLVWVMVPIAAVGVVVLAMLGGVGVDQPAPSPPVQAAAPVMVPKQEPTPVVQQADDTSPRGNTSRRGGRLQAARRPTAPERVMPEVLISPEEQIAFESVVAMTRRVRVSEATMLSTDSGSAQPPLSDLEVSPITEIAPLRIEPLQVAALR